MGCDSDFVGEPEGSNLIWRFVSPADGQAKHLQKPRALLCARVHQSLEKDSTRIDCSFRQWLEFGVNNDDPSYSAHASQSAGYSMMCLGTRLVEIDKISFLATHLK